MQITLETKLGLLVKNRLRVGLLRKLGVETVQQLLQYFPRRLESGAILRKSFADLRKHLNRDTESDKVAVVAKITSISLHPMAKGQGSRLQYSLSDSSGSSFSAVYFAKNYRYLNFLKAQHSEGEEVLAVGQAKIRQSVQMVHPELIKLPADDGVSAANPLRKGEIIAKALRPRPIYPATAKLSSDKIHQTILDVMAQIEALGASEKADEWSGESKSAAKPAKAVENLLFPSILPAVLPDIPSAGAHMSGEKPHLRWKVLKMLHNPETEDDFELASEQLRLEEAFILQTVLALRRLDINLSRAKAYPLDERGVREKLLKKLPELLGGELTNSQREVVGEIEGDLARTYPMRRLLQGDVGSGKTVVALLGMLQVMDAGGQAVLIAPTETLARQHYQKLLEMCRDTLRKPELAEQEICLLVGALSAAQSRETRARIRSGQAKLIVGTQALLGENLEFRELGLVVVDEQHRFGVEQRDKLLNRPDGSKAHLLIMSATPIPRTVAMSIFADLEVSTISELPRGRQPIQSFIIEQDNQKWRDRMWEKVREEIDQDHKVFIVVPRIDESDDSADAYCEEMPKYSAHSDTDRASPNANACEKSSERDVDDNCSENDELSDALDDGLNSPEDERFVSEQAQSIFARLSASLNPLGLAEPLEKDGVSIEKMKKLMKKIPPLKGVEFGVLHGRMAASEKEQVMAEFQNGKVQLLLATSVVEVGIDIPDATVMVVMDADHFGVASLHQLRGRVGRGKLQSWCFLVESKKPTVEGEERLNIIVSTLDGFQIAREDLELRGEGDIVSKTQAGGKSSLKLLNVLRDQDIIELAHSLAVSILKDDPNLDRHLGLKTAVQREIEESQREFLARA